MRQSIPLSSLRTVLTVLALSSCGGDAGTGPRTVASVAITSPTTPVAFATLGRTAQVSAEARSTSGAALPGRTISWTSSNASVASVGSDGLVTARGNGATFVRASCDGVVSAPLSVVVQQVAASVVLSPDTLAFTAKGRQQSLTAVVADSGGNAIAGATLAWASDAQQVAVVMAGLVTALSDGVAHITAVSSGIGSAPAVVTVRRVPAGIRLSPTAISFGARGSQRQMAAFVQDSMGWDMEAPGPLAWASTDPAVVTVNSTGLLTSAGDGAAQVSATVGALSSNASVTVSPVTVRIEVTPATASLATLGRTQQFTARALDSNGYTVADPGPITWETNDTVAIRLDQAGLATAIGDGGPVNVVAWRGALFGQAVVGCRIALLSLEMAPLPVQTRLNREVPLAITARDSNGTLVPSLYLDITTSNPGAVLVGVFPPRIVTVGDGTATVRIARGGAVPRNAEIEVAVQAVPMAVRVAGSVVLDWLGASTQLEGEVVDSGGTHLTNRNVEWRLFGPGASAAVSPTGLVSALAVGSADTAVAIHAYGADTLTGRVPIQVVQTVSSVTVARTSTDTLRTTGRTAQFTATAWDRGGSPIPTARFQWFVLPVGMAAVDSTGLLTALGDGDASACAGSLPSVYSVFGCAVVPIRRYARTFALTPSGPVALTSPGASQAFDATAIDSSGASLPIAWISRSTAVLTAYPSSGAATRATAAWNGVTHVVMSAGTRRDSAQVSVSGLSGTVSFASEIQPILTSRCTSCHNDVLRSGELSLASGSSYTGLIYVDASGAQGERRVVPLSVGDSYLARKVDPGASPVNGVRMPYNGSPLTASQLQLIRDWIAQGAMNN
jgi:uncharacterized protein YjdB